MTLVRPVVAVCLPIPPVLTHPRRLRQCSGLIQGRPNSHGSLAALKDLEAESFGSVPGNVAMQQPVAGVVGLERDDDKTARGKEDYVAPGRVVKFELEFCVLR